MKIFIAAQAEAFHQTEGALIVRFPFKNFQN
jgi:hypothetical protein